MKIITREIAGFESALYGMRSPMNSWGKSDTYITIEDVIKVGSNDLNLATRLINGGPEHRKFLRQIQVWADFDMPRYWWSEMDTYKIGTSANSCSTMHRLLNNQKPITKDMFVSHPLIEDILELVIKRL
ncbi:MAG: hypothetical protein ACRCX8_05745, partial [Sarcina sp.]